MECFFIHTKPSLSGVVCVYCHLVSIAQGVALQNIALAIAVVFLSIAVLSGFALAAVVSSLVLGTTLGTVGLVRGGGERGLWPPASLDRLSFSSERRAFSRRGRARNYRSWVRRKKKCAIKSEQDF